MTKIMALNSIRDTTLWKQLENGFKRKIVLQSLVTKLLSTVEELCDEATARMKTMPSFHPEFTLHDETHLLRVTELMGKVLGKSLKSLNPVELALLMLAAQFHDQGMVVDADKLHKMKESAKYKIHADTWAINHPNLSEIDKQLQSPNVSEAEKKRLILKMAELQHAMIGEYVRRKHGRFSGEFVRRQYEDDKRLEVVGVNLANMLALLCESHVLSGEEIKKFHCDELVGTNPVNLRYLAVILRLADILDFDRDRTPDVLYRTIHFSNEVSLKEWEKHRSVQGWVIRPNLIRFDMKFVHPVYERTAREFLDWIDAELTWAHEIMRSMPGEFDKKYKIELPQRVDRSRIGPKNNCYVYYDLEFCLSRDEVVKLLMGIKLYSSPSLCVRELLQNSLDALRYRKALFKTEDLDWKDGIVEFKHTLDGDGYETLTCHDNGVGMDEMVITQFLTNVGRSFYRSPYFDIERARLKEKDIDFDPCSQFGIGFMTCFMLGDRIRIETRRDYGPGRARGKPLVVEINGLGSMLVIREGKKGQPVGTTVSIKMREKPEFVDEWSDKVRLIRVLNGYALAVDFPINAMCKVPGIERQVTIKPAIEYWPTMIEKANIERQITIERKFTEIDPRLKGALRESFLLNDSGVPTIENNEARWELPTEAKKWPRLIVKKSGEQYDRTFTETEGQTCLDGILVCGPPGRGKRENWIGCYTNLVGRGSLFTLDVRGDLKPEIMAARTPPERLSHWNIGPTWERIQEFIYHAEGRLWEQVSEFLEKGLCHRELWKMSVVYNALFTTMRAKVIWERMRLPVVDGIGSCEWRALWDIKEAIPKRIGDEYELMVLDGKQISPPEEIIVALDKQSCDELTFSVKSLAILMSRIRIHHGKIRLEFQPPIESSILPAKFMLKMGPFVKGYAIPYDSENAELLTVQCAIRSVNQNHPLVQLALESRFFENKNIVQEFAKSTVECLADKDTLEKISCDKEVPTRWMKMIAHRYLALDWSRYNQKLRPPYQIWLEDRGMVEVTDEDFHNWAKKDSRTPERS